MRNNKKSMKQIVGQYWPTAPEHEMEAAGNRVLKRLQADLEKHDTPVRSLYSDASSATPVKERDSQVLTAVHVFRRRGEVDIRTIVEMVRHWAKNLQFVDVCLALNNLENQGLVMCRRFGEGASEASPLYEITVTGKREVARRRAELWDRPMKTREGEDCVEDGCTEKVR